MNFSADVTALLEEKRNQARATAIVATFATEGPKQSATVAKVATVAPAPARNHNNDDPLTHPIVRAALDLWPGAVVVGVREALTAHELLLDPTNPEAWQ